MAIPSYLDDATMAGLMDVAIDASRKAGDIISQYSYGVQVQRSKANARDLVTLIDPICEKVNIPVSSSEATTHVAYRMSSF